VQLRNGERYLQVRCCLNLEDHLEAVVTNMRKLPGGSLPHGFGSKNYHEEIRADERHFKMSSVCFLQ
jgi:hypothetical protein